MLLTSCLFGWGETFFLERLFLSLRWGSIESCAVDFWLFISGSIRVTLKMVCRSAPIKLRFLMYASPAAIVVLIFCAWHRPFHPISNRNPIAFALIELVVFRYVNLSRAYIVSLLYDLFPFAMVEISYCSCNLASACRSNMLKRCIIRMVPECMPPSFVAVSTDRNSEEAG